LLFGLAGVAMFPGETLVITHRIGVSLGSRSTFEGLVEKNGVFEFLTVFFEHLRRVFPHWKNSKDVAETAIDGDWTRKDVYREGRFFSIEINSRIF
jgi:hypothetical protein